MKRNHSAISLHFIIGLLALGSLASFAAGIRLPDQDAFSMSRGEAFAATADNPSAIYYNPAGITQLKGVNVRAGAYVIDLRPSFESATTGGKLDNRSQWHALPQIFATYSPEDFPLAFGLGAYSPYGLGVKWPAGTGFDYIATESHLKYMTLNPVVAWRVLPSLSVAAGATLNYASTDLRNAWLRFDGDGTAVGYNLGVRWEPCQKIALGVSYRSETRVKFDGFTEVLGARADSNTRLAFPQNIIMGISYRPTPKWNIEFDEDYTDWRSVGTLNIANVGPMVLNWQPGWFHEFGVTRYFENGWHVSGGYIYNESCIRNETFTPLVPEVDLHLFCAGLGFQGKHFSFDAAYQFGYGPEHTVHGSPSSTLPSPPFPLQNADGKYSSIIHGIMLSAGWRF